MLIDYFLYLKAWRIPVTTGEFLQLLAALQERIAAPALSEFYYLSRLCLVKNEAMYDRFDQAFASFFHGVAADSANIFTKEIPAEWLQSQLEKFFSDKEREEIAKLGWDKLMEEFAKRLAEQEEEHHGGSKWIGTGGKSPFGNNGVHPEGIRVGGQSKNRSAVKVWQQREFRDLDDQVELGTRNMKLALRRLRQFARSGSEFELDLEQTISRTAKNAGYLDLCLRAEKHNSIKVLLLIDIGGSMDMYVKICEQLFSACRSEFKFLEHYYFHNCVYDFLWKNNQRRHIDRINTFDLIHKYSSDYKVIFIGDAAMSPYEIERQYGSVEYSNQESGETWLKRLLAHFSHVVWINPEARKYWQQIASTRIINNLINQRMVPMTIEGINQAVKILQKSQ